MPARLSKTKKHRSKKEKKLGAAGKRSRENKGTTPSIPLDNSSLPSLRYGRPVKPESIVTPESLK